MINILKKEDCVGCNACVQRCPISCISMNEDEQGFLYPKVDVSKCINCSSCDRACPVINQGHSRIPLSVYAAKNRDKAILKSSSSGGVFYALAQKVIEDGGVVFGARFDNEWRVIHDWTETIEGLKAFQGSKYVQSRIGNTYQQVENFLKSGRKVMFTGTPCQLSGLQLFLRKDYGDRLLKVELICHGIPSPLVWREYLKYITPRQVVSAKENLIYRPPERSVSLIGGISFRDKRFGWEKYGFTVRLDSTEIFNIHNDDPYFWAFNTDYTLRPACFFCPAKSGRSGADITIGDFWHIKENIRDFYDEDGVSLIVINSENGTNILNCLNLDLHTSNYETALKCVPAIAKTEKIPSRYQKFWNDFYQNGIITIYEYYRKFRYTRLQKFIINPIKAILGQRTVTLVKKIIK